ncbi:Protein F41C3.5 [Aphelenchoides avenae]|nr:Protein F41C3.5 [Aphelenchus avenae]
MALYVGPVALLLLAAGSAAHKDEIVDLPGLSFKTNFKHYSGYLNASETRFVESQGNPSTDPLVFWFNGGPGCSSLEGLLAEHGPYFLNNDTNSLRKNEYAWNKTSAENYRAIKHFLKKFPQFRNHSIFVTGESYAGIYVPTLAERIIDGQKDFFIKLELTVIQIKGIAIGNGLLNDDVNQNSLVEFFYGHGFIDPSEFQALDRCCESDITRCDLKGKCAQQHAQAAPKYIGHLNPYDIYRHCSVPQSLYTLQAPFLKMSEKAYTDDATLCNPHFGPYLNKLEVRKALHVPDHVGTWQECAPRSALNYTGVYKDMSHRIVKIIDNNVRVLLYYGDTDMMCNFVGGQKFADSLDFKRLSKKQAWNFDGFLAGFKTEYEKNLTYITVGGVGHMVPQWQPKGALYFFGQFLKNEPI